MSMSIVEILSDDGKSWRPILASAEFAEEHYSGKWRLVDVEPPSAPEPVQQRHVSVLAFRRRFAPAERAALEWAAVDRADQPNSQRQQAAALRASLADQAAAEFIDLDDPDTIAGVEMLEAMGLLATGRAEQIIATPVQPGELPK